MLFDDKLEQLIKTESTYASLIHPRSKYALELCCLIFWYLFDYGRHKWLISNIEQEQAVKK
jgi:hypothetical protein